MLEKEVIIAIGIYRTATGDYWSNWFFAPYALLHKKLRAGTGYQVQLSLVWKNGN